MDSATMHATLIASEEFLRRADMFDVLREAMPDFLKEHTGRVALARARWKELWATRPSSMAQLEQLLVKLVEQALWAATEDTIETLPHSDKGTTGNVTFEPWMEMETLSPIKSLTE